MKQAASRQSSAGDLWQWRTNPVLRPSGRPVLSAGSIHSVRNQGGSIDISAIDLALTPPNRGSEELALTPQFLLLARQAMAPSRLVP